MRVKNRKTIWNLSLKSFRASGKRNLIAVVAIVLTTVLFTSLFTIVMSLNESYQTYTFRQIGGYAHGTFKDVTDKQAEEIKGHKKVKAAGERVVAGIIAEGVFARVPAEVSYMDENNTKWSYIDLKEGREPEGEKEIILDDAALELLGVTPELGAEVTLTYQVSDKKQNGGVRTDTFTLVGWWEYDPVMPVHYINVSRTYMEQLERDMTGEGLEPFRRDLNVMLSSSLDIDGTMEEIEEDLGYQRDDPGADTYLNYGVNWGYTTAQAAAELDPGLLAAMAAFLLLVIFTGYLIIYNIFQISVTGDIRYYGLLKTIGVTPGQLRRIIRQQALLLCGIGCPLGLIAGWLVGSGLVPVVLARTSLETIQTEVSSSPLIFAASALFAVATVLLSCGRPGRMAAKVSPVEAVKYTETGISSRKERRSSRTGIGGMAFANLGRNKKRTALVVISLSLSVVLLALTFQFTGGFSMEKYLEQKTCADFIVGNTDYFRFQANGPESGLAGETVEQIRENTKEADAGQAWAVPGVYPKVWLDEEQFRSLPFAGPEEQVNQELQIREKRGDKIQVSLQAEGMDDALLDKLTVLEGSLDPLRDPEGGAIALPVETDDYGTPQMTEHYPRPGDKLTVTYVDEGYYADSRTGEPVTDATPEEYIQYHIEKSHDVEYTVCALVTVPYQISFRASLMYGMDAIMGTEQLKADSREELYSLFYMFDTPNREAEEAAEHFLAELTEGETSPLMYESKALVRQDFQGFRQMFLLLGGALCAIVGVVGILNFFNAILTGILVRKREFAMLQAVGMTGKQLKKMLVTEGLLYAGATILLSLVLVFLLEPLVGGMLEDMFWFFAYHFDVTALWAAAPVFLLLGVVLPLGVYRGIARMTIVERLREVE